MVNFVMATKLSHVARNTAMEDRLVQIWTLELILVVFELKPAESTSSVLAFAI